MGCKPKGIKRAHSQETKAIETPFHGYRMRSRLEARWGVYFEALGVKWEYEKEGFETPFGRYLPDFWLPQVSMWAEVKPTWPADELRKFDAVVQATNFPLLILDGLPEAVNYWAIVPEDEPSQIDSAGIHWMDYLFSDDRYWMDESRLYGDTGNVYPGREKLERSVDLKALDAARAARFEFGEAK